MTKEDVKSDIRNLLSKQYEVLGHNELGFTELRLPKKGIQKFFRSQSDYSIEVTQEYLNGDCYVGINPRKTKSGKAEDVSHITAIVIDFDPIRPKDTASSDAEHDNAIQLAMELYREYPTAIVVDSGSGSHVYIPINPIEVNDKIKLTKALQAFNYEIKAKYETKNIKVDAVFDLPRIIRVWGSFNEKSKRICNPIIGTDTFRRIEFDIEKYAKLNNIQSSTKNIKSDSPISNRFDKLLSINNNLKNMFNGLGQYSSRSEADFALTNYLITAKFTDQEILDIRKRSPLSKSEDRSDEWILQDITRIRQKNQSKENKVFTVDDSYFKELETRKAGTMTGFSKLDFMIAGLKEGRLIALCARPSVGKTTLLTQLSKNLSKNKKRVLFFTTEAGAPAIYDKIVSSETNIVADKFQFGFSEDEKKRIYSVANDIKSLPLYVVENFALTPEVIEKHIKELVPDIVIIDYFNRMSFPDKGDAKDQAAVISKLDRLCKEYKLPLIVASQLNRSTEESVLSFKNIKGTGSIEEASDIVIFLSTLDKNSNPIIVSLTVMKNRYGKTGHIKLNFKSDVCTFQEA